MSQQAKPQVMVPALHLFGTPNSYEFKKTTTGLGSVRIKDHRNRDVFRVGISGSLHQAQMKVVDVNESLIAKLKKKMATLHCEWTAYGSGGDALFSINNADVFPKETSINLVCKKDAFSIENLLLDGILASEGISLAAESQGSSRATKDASVIDLISEVEQLAAEYVRFNTLAIGEATLLNSLRTSAAQIMAQYTCYNTQAIDGARLDAEASRANNLNAEATRLIAKGARLNFQAAEVARQIAESTCLHALAIAVTRLNFEGERLIAEVARLNASAPDGARPTSEDTHLNTLAAKGTRVCTLAVMGSRLNDIANKNRGVPERHDAPDLKFQFKGSWTGKTCAMYIAHTEIKIAQMRPLDDNNGEGFSVDVLPNVNCEFVITSFAAVEAMKSVAQKQKELLGDVFCFTGKLLCGITSSVVGGSFVEF